jgi:mRNA degradation ribonuclease J1/J2
MKLRRKIMQAGIVICSVVLNGTGKIVCTPKISAPASLDYVEDAQIIADIEADILKLLSGKLVAQVMQAKNKKKNADETMRDAIKQVIRRHFSNKVGTLPLIQIEIHTI